MSAIDLAKYVQHRMDTMNLSITGAAKTSGISRQTWHKLRQADIKEAKLSTLVKVAAALKTTPFTLVNLYFQKPLAKRDFSVGELPKGHMCGIKGMNTGSVHLGSKTL